MQRHPQRLTTASLPPIHIPSLKKIRTLGLFLALERAMAGTVAQHQQESTRLFRRHGSRPQ